MGIEKPFENTKLAKYVTEHLKVLAPVKSRQQIAVEAGYDRPNIISMIEHGHMKMPLDKVPAFAKALDCDVGLLMRFAIEQHLDGETARHVVPRLFKNVITDEEMQVVAAMRMLREGKQPELSINQLEHVRRLAAEAKPIP